MRIDVLGEHHFRSVRQDGYEDVSIAGTWKNCWMTSSVNWRRKLTLLLLLLLFAGRRAINQWSQLCCYRQQGVSMFCHAWWYPDGYTAFDVCVQARAPRRAHFQCELAALPFSHDIKFLQAYRTWFFSCDINPCKRTLSICCSRLFLFLFLFL